ncbi:MAG: tetratricopeptide repeat protein [Syntrophobacteraceae bacterium]
MEVTGLGTGCDQAKVESVRGLFNQAEAALSANRPVDAAACFDMVLRDDPFNAKAHSGLSRAYWEQGRTEDSLNSLTRALELEPNDRETVLQCSQVFGALGKSDFADEVLKSYLERNPGDAEARASMQPRPASVPAAAGMVGAGMVGARTVGGPMVGGPMVGAASSRDFDASEVAEIFRRQGVVQFECGRLDRAITCLEMALENNPAHAEAHSDLGIIYQRSGNIENALEHFYKALELNPEDPEILGNSARALSLAGETAAAADLFREYLRRRPEDEAAWGEYEELVRRSAVPQWESDSASPEVAGIYVETAKKLMGAGDLPGAAEAVEKALAIMPGAADAMLVLASLHNEVGQRDEAVSVLEHALELDPSSRDCEALLESIRNANGSGA